MDKWYEMDKWNEQMDIMKSTSSQSKIPNLIWFDWKQDMKLTLS